MCVACWLVLVALWLLACSSSLQLSQLLPYSTVRYEPVQYGTIFRRNSIQDHKLLRARVTPHGRLRIFRSFSLRSSRFARLPSGAWVLFPFRAQGSGAPRQNPTTALIFACLLFLLPPWVRASLASFPKPASSNHCEPQHSHCVD